MEEDVEPHPPPPPVLPEFEKWDPARARRVFLPLPPPPHFWKTRDTTHSSYVHGYILGIIIPLDMSTGGDVTQSKCKSVPTEEVSHDFDLDRII